MVGLRRQKDVLDSQNRALVPPSSSSQCVVLLTIWQAQALVAQISKNSTHYCESFAL
jgi:hypothetical protein